jgi:hypothetical protein
MAPAPSKLAPPLTTQPERTGQRKRKVSSRITDENFVGAESNIVTKRLKQASDAARAAAVKHHQRQLSVEDVEEEDSARGKNSPKEASSRAESDPASVPGNAEESDDNDEPKLIEPVETADKQRGKSNKPW